MTQPPYRILFLNTYYDGFLQTHYNQNPGLEYQSYQHQLHSLQSTCFGDSDFYSHGMTETGWIASDLIINARHLQSAWAREHGANTDNLLAIAAEQVRQFQPDVVYLQDISPITSELMATLKASSSLIAWQIASPVPDGTDLSGIDIIFSSFPHFVERFRQQGKTAWYQPLAFDPRVLEQLQAKKQPYPLTFIGGISPHHGRGLDALVYLASKIPLDVWGYGVQSLSPDSALRQHHHGEAWGLEMFSLLASSRITINRHIDVAENHANNMRLFEATGCGALLLTDYRDNLSELFEIGKEVVAYRTPEEAVLLANYYLQHPDKAAAIAKAGQERTLRDHSYQRRMRQTAEILERHLRYLDEKDLYPAVDYSHISYGYNHIQCDQVVASMEQGWQNTAIPFRQRALVQVELDAMYHSQPPQPFQVIAELLKPVVGNGMDLLEIGCASGYYAEVIEYLLSKQIKYTGVDYSAAMIAMAQNYYPQRSFMVADGAQLPFGDQSFPLVISGCVLLHTTDYSKHIAETARVAKDWIAVHRTPVCRLQPTQYLSKLAYGVETVEMLFNEQELLNHFTGHGFELKQSLIYAQHPEQDQYEVSYLLKRVSAKLSTTTPFAQIVQNEPLSEDLLLFESDWLASSPYFYNQRTGQHSPNVNDVIDHDNLQLHPEGFLNYLDFGYSVFEQTPICGIKFLPASARLYQSANGSLRMEKLPDPVIPYLGKQTDPVDLFDRLVSQVRNWEQSASGPIIIPTSGGYDSRLLNLLIHDKSRIASYSYGISKNQFDSCEVVKAQELSRILGTSWKRIHLGTFNRFIHRWYEHFGIATHAHGMYHFEFYDAITSEQLAGANLLSGIVGDAWAGCSLPCPSTVEELILLGYSHGLRLDPACSRLTSDYPLRQEYWEHQRELLQDPAYRVVAMVRNKMILLSYLMKLPGLSGFVPWTPFLDIETAMGMLMLPQAMRDNRVWQKAIFAANNVDLEECNLNCTHENYLDIEAARSSELPLLDNTVIERLVTPAIADMITAISTKKLKRNLSDQQILACYTAYTMFAPLSFLLQGKEIAT